jgi:hypothetical protein
MQNPNFKVFTTRMTPRNKLLAAFVAIFVMVIALFLMLAVAVGGAILGIGAGIIGGLRRLLGLGGNSYQKPPTTPTNSSGPRTYEGLDPSKRIDQPRD